MVSARPPLILSGFRTIRDFVIVCLTFLGTIGTLGGQDLVGKEPAKAAEPTNAAEAAAKKAAQDAAIDEKYQALVAKLPPEEQAWERTLQANLGGFYLPIHKREKVMGTLNAWAYVKDDPKLPRVLLIGDSVSRGYTLATRRRWRAKPMSIAHPRTAARPPMDSRSSMCGWATENGT